MYTGKFIPKKHKILFTSKFSNLQWTFFKSFKIYYIKKFKFIVKDQILHVIYYLKNFIKKKSKFMTEEENINSLLNNNCHLSNK